MSHRSRFGTLLAKILLVWLAWAAAASAQETVLSDPLAVDLKGAGDRALDQGHYREALDAYQRAAAVEPSPILRFNQARALQALRRYPEALDQLEAFRREASDELKARVPGLDELMASVQRQVSSIELSVNVSGATVFFDGRRLGVTPLPEPVRVNAGSGKLLITAEGRNPYARTLQLSGGTTQHLEVSLKRVPTAGVLSVRSSVSGTQVFVDGAFAGMVPVELSLPPGRHLVELRHSGYGPMTTQVVLSPREHKSLDGDPVARPTLFQRWWFWGAIGALAVGGTVTVAALVTEKDPSRGSIPPGTVSAPLRLGF